MTDMQRHAAERCAARLMAAVALLWLAAVAWNAWEQIKEEFAPHVAAQGQE